MAPLTWRSILRIFRDICLDLTTISIGRNEKCVLNICTLFLETDLDFKEKNDHNIWNPEVMDINVLTLLSYNSGPTGFERFHTKHCRCCYGLTPWPQWTWNSSQVCILSCPSLFLFRINSSCLIMFSQRQQTIVTWLMHWSGTGRKYSIR